MFSEKYLKQVKKFKSFYFKSGAGEIRCRGSKRNQFSSVILSLNDGNTMSAQYPGDDDEWILKVLKKFFGSTL